MSQKKPKKTISKTAVNKPSAEELGKVGYVSVHHLQQGQIRHQSTQAQFKDLQLWLNTEISKFLYLINSDYPEAILN